MLLIVAFISLGTFAQVDKKDQMEQHHETHNMNHDIDSEAHAMMYADKVTTRLNLTHEQKEQIQQAHLKRLESQKEMMAKMMSESGNMGSDNAELKKQKMKIQQDFKDEMKNILSSAEYKEWQPMYEREMKMEGKDKYKNKNKN